VTEDILTRCIVEKVEDMAPGVLGMHDVLFRALFDASPMPLLVLAPPDWTIIAANEARLRVTGTRREEQIGRRLFGVFPDDPNDPHADGVQKLTASLERVVRTKSADAMEVQRYDLVDANGQFVQRWWTPINTPVLNDDGVVEYVIHRVEDVTEVMLMRGEAQARDQVARDQHEIIETLRTTDHALVETTERLRFFRELEERLFSSAGASDAMSVATEMLGEKLGTSRCAYADVDGDGDRFWIRNDYSAPGLETSAGTYSLALFGPRAVTDLRAGRALVVSDVSGELEPGAGREMFQSIGIDAIICCPLIKEGRLTAMMAVHQNRRRVWTSDEIAFVKEVAERCWAHVERVGAEARLRESEERLRLVVENADVGFWDLDVVNDTLIWPPRTKAMFGISADTPVTMQDFYDGLHTDDREATGAAFAAATDPNQRALYDVEYRTIGKEDGVIRWVAAKGRGVFDPNGRCLRVAGTAIEITARKEAEEGLRELNATLEARIAAAIAEREEIQAALRQSQKMEAMGQLTGGVAHDFNNLLTPIVGSLDMLQRKGLGGEREQRMIAGAVQSAERARVLVQRLLAFARRQPLQLVSVDIVKLVTDMGALVSSTTGPQIRVSVETPEILPLAKADPNQLEMAILNLAVNARDAMPDGGTVRISASPEAIHPGHRSGLRAGHYIRLSVADTGVGMDEAILARAVEPFFSTKGVGKGTGLGLSMVHGLALQLGGAITIQSRPGLGTNVELWLPQSADVLDPVPVIDVPPIQPVSGIALLVDDEALVRMSTADMLTELGYVVIEAASGEAAMRLVDAGKHFDLLVTDHLMPGMNGTDLALAVRAVRPNVPVLLVSGYAENEGVDPSLPRLTKPFRADELAASLAQIST
jgi:PAS domain S-box-containing protein